MEFKIIAEHQIQFAFPDVPAIAISLTDLKSKHTEYPKSENLLDVLKLNFDDVDHDIATNPVARNYIAITDKQGNQILDFVERYKDKVELIICQCQAGISRSSATAAALSIILNGPRSDKWCFHRSKYCPNMKVYRTILNMWEARQ